jgi:hypothetical protein
VLLACLLACRRASIDGKLTTSSKQQAAAAAAAAAAANELKNTKKIRPSFSNVW